MTRVALITNIIAHYRRPLFTALLAQDMHPLTLVGDSDSSRLDPTIATWQPPPGSHLITARLTRILGRFIWQSGVLGVATSSRFDCLIFVADMNCLSTWLAAPLARLLGKRVHFWAHGWRRRERGLSGLIRRWFFSFPDSLLVYGRRSRVIALENGLDAQRVHVVYNSLDYEAQRIAYRRIDLTQRQRMREEMFGSADGAVVACPTRLIALRRLDLLLEAVARVKREKNRIVRVLLVGDGPERKHLEALAAKLEIQVHFAGACYHEERMAQYLTAATCTVAPGMVGLSAMHSLAFGVPVLTHGDADAQMPEAEAVVDGHTGAFFRAGDQDDLARVIEIWTRTSYPSDEVSASCIRVIERFYNPQSQLEVFLALLDGRVAVDPPGEGIQAWELSPDPV